MEACLTCMACLNILREPTSCVPCGHSWCAQCLADAGGACPECHSAGSGAAAPLTIYPSVTVPSLASLAANFEFQKRSRAKWFA